MDRLISLPFIPTHPGVYRMLDKNGAILYVGKSKNLHKRVSSYFSRQNHNQRIKLLVSLIAEVEYSITRTEAEALLLETHLIKAHSPRFNILFRDDKSYPYIVLSKHLFPRISLFRGNVNNTPGDFYGPFPHTNAVHSSIRFLQSTFRLRTCEDTMFKNRSRPCLLYQINRCSGPCVGNISEARYAEDLLFATQFLRGKHDTVLTLLSERMEKAADTLSYEQAAIYRDQIQALRQVQESQFVVSRRTDNADIIVVKKISSIIGVSLAMIRNGQYLGDRVLFPEHTVNADEQEAITAFISQHYARNDVPNSIVLPLLLPNEKDIIKTLSAIAERSIRIVTATTKERRAWIDMAYTSLEMAINARISAQGMQLERLKALSELLAINDELKRIECIDISHHQGEATMGACVVYQNGSMDKRLYRRYRIRDANAGDDFAAIGEVVRRRFSDSGSEALPDVLLIDGGLGQLKYARQELEEVGLSDAFVLVGIAKGVTRRDGAERLYVHGEPIKELNPHSSHLGRHIIQEVRDEAHRFALFGHRSRYQKTRLRSKLESIPQVGTMRRRALLGRFGSVKGVTEARPEELSKVPGISPSLAQTVYDYLHS